MTKTARSRVIRLAEAQQRIPGPAGEHSVSLMQRGTLEVKLSLPVIEEFYFTTASGTRSNRATFSL